MTIEDGHSHTSFEHKAKNKFLLVRTIELQNTQRIPMKFGIIV